MRTIVSAVVMGAIVLGAVPQAQAQRRSAAGPKAPGAAAKVYYKQKLDEDGIVDNFEGQSTWTDEPAGAFGSKGSLKVGQGGEGGGTVERYIKWQNDDATVAFMFYAHGAKAGYFQGRGEKAGKNLHANFNIEAQDTWQFVKIKADSLIGFGGGASSPGESFRNLIWHIEEYDKAVENGFLLLDSIVVYSGQDGTPPTAPAANVTVKWYAEGGAASINWDPAQDDVGVYQYEVHRSEAKGFEPAKETKLATVADTYFEDKSVAAGKTYYYKIVAKDLGGYTVPSADAEYKSEQAGGGGAAAKPAAKAEF